MRVKQILLASRPQGIPHASDFQIQEVELPVLMEGEGKIHYTETIMNGFEQLPTAFLGLFSGANTGKMIVRV